MCLGVFLVYLVWDSGLPGLGGYFFLSHVREFFNYSLKYVLLHFLFFSSSVTPMIRMLVCLMLSQRSLRLSSFLFILVLHSVLLQLFPPSYLPAHLSILLPYLCHLLLQCIFISVIVLFIVGCLVYFFWVFVKHFWIVLILASILFTSVSLFYFQLHHLHYHYSAFFWSRLSLLFICLILWFLQWSFISCIFLSFNFI